jgi:hypothetical protein
MECEGQGLCISECECSYLEGTNDCHCLRYTHGHLKNKHRRFCIKKVCGYRCVLKKCQSYNYCEDSYPEWWYTTRGYTTGNQCNYCGIYAVKFTNKFDHCEICFMDKYLIETECNHPFCLDCLINMNGMDDDNPDSPCPFCRKNIEHNPLNIR